MTTKISKRKTHGRPLQEDVISSQGDVELSVPRDRTGEYEPQIVKKPQMDISEIEDKILFLYSQGNTF